MKNRTRLAVATWNGRISPVFDVARQVSVFDIEGGRVLGRRDEALPGTDLREQANRLAALNPQVLICGAVSQPMAQLLATTRICIIPFTAGDVEQVLGAWLVGTLPNAALSMPGCCGRIRWCHGRGGGIPGGREWGKWEHVEPRTAQLDRRNRERNGR